MLKINQLACQRGDRLLFADLNLELNSGELLYVEGANGAGKTTLLRTLARLFTPLEGAIFWQGEAVSELGEEYHRQFLHIGHRPAVKDSLTASENLRYALQLAGRASDRATLDGALATMGLDGYQDQPARALSFGQRRRIILAQLLLTRAPLWLLDEPFNALDVRAVTQLSDIIRAHLANGGMVVLTTHQPIAWGETPVRTLRLG
jgi:heme exporter protein A